MRLRSLLTITNALLIGCLIGWAARTHTLNDRYMTAKIDKYETETSYWISKLNDEIQQNKASLENTRQGIKENK